MGELHFIATNAEQTADAFISISESICGDLVEHKGIMGKINLDGSQVAWYIALTDKTKPNHEGLLTLIWEDTPSTNTMRQVFDILDTIETKYQGTRKFNIEEYPIWTELI